jgi:hypothetical protein
MSLFQNIVSKFSAQKGTEVPIPAPAAFDIVAIEAGTVEIKFGYTSLGRTDPDPNQTYAAFVAQQAKITSTTLQANYTPQYIVNGKTYVVDPTLTFAELNTKYDVSPTTPVVVSVPDPQQAVGKLG